MAFAEKICVLAPGSISDMVGSLNSPSLGLLQVSLHRLDQLIGAAAALGVFDRIDDVEADMVLDHLGHQARQRAARGDDQMQYGGAALFVLERAFDRFDLATHPASRTVNPRPDAGPPSAWISMATFA